MSLFTDPRVLTDSHILNLFNLSPNIVQSIDIYHNQGTMIADIKLEPKPHECPSCGFMTSSIKDYTKRNIIHSVLTTVPCTIRYRARRYRCPACNKSFFEHNPFSHKNMKLSAATVLAILADLKKPTETFTTVASRYHVSTTTAASIFDSHVCVSRKPLPRRLCIDEVYGFSSDRSNYMCVLVDFDTGQTIDLLPTRKLEDILKYFSYIPLEERNQVEMFCSDMWVSYRQVASSKLPKAKFCIDRFHVIQEELKRIDSIRIKTMNDIRPIKSKPMKDMTIEERTKYNKDHRNYYLLKKFNWLLFKNEKQMTKYDPKLNKQVSTIDPNYEKRYNGVWKRYLNYYDIYHLMLEIEPKLTIAMNLKYALDQFYETCTYENASQRLLSIIDEFHFSGINELMEFAKTLRFWKDGIVNSFFIPNGMSRRINNGIIENRNKVIKQLKRNSNGYKNWNRFRNRSLYVLNKDVTFSMNPIEVK